jgi:hypothetical protein
MGGSGEGLLVDSIWQAWDWRRKPAVFLFALVLGTALIVAASVPARASDGLHGIMLELMELCRRAPAGTCVDWAWPHVDLDDDRRLSVSESELLLKKVRTWALRHRADLVPEMRNGVFLGLMVVQTLGVERLITSYDSNGDGSLSRGELLQDLRVDGRPLPDLIRDPEGFDRASFAKKLGAAAPLVPSSEAESFEPTP